MGICHPEAYQFQTAATSWGCWHERDALEQYKKQRAKGHDTLCISPCGFFISASHPYFGASPDGMVHCLCCGPGVCEVKVNEYMQ